ncbi:putative uncharacterized protein DDB_G0282133 [Frankliniella occidentalis]|uniref:GATA zinc finger domain-containing protein 14-like n=1 Tax=Frankliniella occidentalis TaxID=133901 RepID=A0A9C6U6I9_FRAOC|nr:putative uncharacterized protein DDB_G0282133 [Frankliniella occidentalis]
MAAAPTITLHPQLPTFSGEDNEDCDLFLTRLNRILSAYPDLPAAQKLFWLDSQCRKGPLALIQREIKRLEAANPPVNDEEKYQAVQDSLRANYNSVEDKHKFRDALQHRIKRENESYPNYFQEVTELCYKAGITNEREHLRYLHRGLPRQIANCVRPKEYDSTHTLLQLVLEVESLQRETARTHSQPDNDSKSMPSQLQSYGFSQPPPTPAVALPQQTSPSPAEDTINKLITKLEALVLSAQPSINAVETENTASSPSAQERQHRRDQPRRSDNNNNTYSQNRGYSPGYRSYSRDNSRDGYRGPQRDNDRYRSSSSSRFRQDGGQQNNYRDPSTSPYRGNGYNRNDDRRPRNYQNNYNNNYNNPRRNFNRDQNQYQPRDQQSRTYYRSNDNRPQQNQRRVGFAESSGRGRTNKTNPSLRTPGRYHEFGEPKITDNPNFKGRSRSPRCNLCEGPHVDSECPVENSMQQKN